MRALPKLLPRDLRLRRRLQYCGTCKSIGSLYGHRFRFLLNHDTVFLAEVIYGISTETEFPEMRDSSLRSLNCLRVPRTDKIPLPLAYAATATVILSKFKLLDHIADDGGFLWRVSFGLGSGAFRSASKRLQAWRFPVAELEEIMATQEMREQRRFGAAEPPITRLGVLAEPTARATGLFLQHGAHLVGRCDIRDLLFQIGFRFGELGYLLDALEDYERDARNAEFNAIRTAWGVSGVPLDQATRNNVVEHLTLLSANLESGLEGLGLDPRLMSDFRNRLRAAVNRYTSLHLPIIQIDLLPETNGFRLLDYLLAVAMPWRADPRNAFLYGRDRAKH